MLDNELIAEFMGLTFKKEVNGIKYYNVPIGHVESHNASMGDFSYHRRWDWLMPVVEKVESLAIGQYGTRVTVLIKDTECIISTESDMSWRNSKSKKINSVYASITSFILWYNEQLTHDSNRIQR